MLRKSYSESATRPPPRPQARPPSHTRGALRSAVSLAVIIALELAPDHFAQSDILYFRSLDTARSRCSCLHNEVTDRQTVLIWVTLEYEYIDELLDDLGCTTVGIRVARRVARSASPRGCMSTNHDMLNDRPTAVDVSGRERIHHGSGSVAPSDVKARTLKHAAEVRGLELTTSSHSSMP